MWREDIMLDELLRLHEEILAQLEAMDRHTAELAPPMDRLPATRQALTRASRARTILLEQHYDRLISVAPVTQRAAIEALRDEGRSNLTVSTQHIGSWPIKEVIGRWSDYCAASNRMRTAMRKRLADEARVVLPLLSVSSVEILPSKKERRTTELGAQVR